MSMFKFSFLVINNCQIYPKKRTNHIQFFIIEKLYKEMPEFLIKMLSVEFRPLLISRTGEYTGIVITPVPSRVEFQAIPGVSVNTGRIFNLGRYESLGFFP